MALIYLSIAWVTGIFLGSKLSLPFWTVFFCLLPVLVIPAWHQHKKVLILIGFCICAFFGGSIYYQSSVPIVNENHLQFYNDREAVEIEGMIVSDPEDGKSTLSFELSAMTILADGNTREVEGKALVHTSKYQGYKYGDVLKLYGKLETPQQFDGFDYASYLAQQSIYSVVYYPGIVVLDTDQGIAPLAWIYLLRNTLSQNINHALPEPQASLAQAIFLGIRTNIPEPLREAFQQTGTAHILAISGLHLSIIIGTLLALGRWLFGRRYSIYIWLALIAIWFYVVLTGMHAPVVRGAIMGSLFLFAVFLGRQRSAATALAFAAAVMVAIEPQFLWNVSFQLSFLAMLGLVVLFPPFQIWGRNVISRTLGEDKPVSEVLYIFSDSIAVSLAATFMIVPVIAYYFHIVPLVGLPATFFALLALPGIIVASTITGLFGFFLPPLATAVGWITWLFLSYLMFVVRSFNALPFSFTAVGEVQIWHALLYYVLLAGIVSIVRFRKQVAEYFVFMSSPIRAGTKRTLSFIEKAPKLLTVLPPVIALILIWIAITTMPDEKLHVSILDVGQGDAILIQTPNGQNILIDGGPNPQSISQCLGNKMPFWDKTIDLVVITQPQTDHVGGLVEVLKRYNVKQVLYPDVLSDAAAFTECLRLTETLAIDCFTGNNSQTLMLGNGIELEVLHPPSSLLTDTNDDIDNNCVALRLSWEEVSFLFTADIGIEVERHLIAERFRLRSDVLKVAHHGSNSSTSSEFLTVVNPSAAVVPVGQNNRFGHPHPSVIDRLVGIVGEDNVFLTAKHGTIEFITDGTDLWVKTSR